MKFICDYYYYPYDFYTSGTYLYILKIFYSIFGPNLFLGNLLSVFFWLITIILILNFLKKFKISDNKILIILLFFCFSPSSIIFSSVTLREPIQLFLITLTGYSFINIFIFKSNIKLNTILIIFSLYVLNTLHHYFYVLSIIFISLLILHYILGKKISLQIIFYILIILCIVIAFLVLDTQEIGLKMINYVHGSVTGSRNIIKAEVAFDLKNSNFILNEDGFFYSRAQYIFEYTYCPGLPKSVDTFNYGASTDFNIDSQDCSNNFSLYYFIFIFTPKLIFYYFFQPIPFISKLSVSDYLVLIENILRISFILYYIKNILFKNYNRTIFIIFLFYLLIEFLFAIGTTNWGTSARHHIVTYGLICMFSFSNVNNLNAKN